MGSKSTCCLISRSFAGLLFAAMLVISASATGKEKVLHPFTGGNDGGDPAAGLVFDKAGNIYGTTVVGGTGSACSGGCGTVFRLTLSGGKWIEKVLYNFQGGLDGKNPYGGVTLDDKGNLYGTTVAGGSGGMCSGDGCGTVFKLTRHGSSYSESVIYSFTGFEGMHADGFGPGAALVFDKKGNLYGTTPDGGDASCNPPNGCGSVFKLTPSGQQWKEKVIHSFTGGKDGAVGSLGSLHVDNAGNLFGVAELGGDDSCNPPNGCGAVYKLAPITGGKWKFSTIDAFQGQPHAGFPYGGLISDAAGSLYGTTYFAGKNGMGSVFKLTQSGGAWKETVLYSFKAGTDGASPTSTLVFDAAGNLYGTTSAGGDSNGDGVVFKLTLSGGKWKESVVHRFGPAPDGANPYYGLTLDKTGNLYGTTATGGNGGHGVVFEITP